MIIDSIIWVNKYKWMHENIKIDSSNKIFRL